MRHVQLLSQNRNISSCDTILAVRNVNITGFEFVDYTLFLVNYGWELVKYVLMSMNTNFCGKYYCKSCLLYFSSINKANLCVSYPAPLSSQRDEDLTCYTFINIISGCILCICTYYRQILLLSEKCVWAKARKSSLAQVCAFTDFFRRETLFRFYWYISFLVL
jgi:hypothetical protein